MTTFIDCIKNIEIFPSLKMTNEQKKQYIKIQETAIKQKKIINWTDFDADNSFWVAIDWGYGKELVLKILENGEKVKIGLERLLKQQELG